MDNIRYRINYVYTGFQGSGRLCVSDMRQLEEMKISLDPGLYISPHQLPLCSFSSSFTILLFLAVTTISAIVIPITVGGCGHLEVGNGHCLVMLLDTKR